MEFYLHVYFTIYPIHPAFRSKYLNREAAQEDYMSRIQNFIRYLETLKNARFQTQEVLGYFALPYLSNPEVCSYLFSNTLLLRIFSHRIGSWS